MSQGSEHISQYLIKKNWTDIHTKKRFQRLSNKFFFFNFWMFGVNKKKL